MHYDLDLLYELYRDGGDMPADTPDVIAKIL